MRGADCCALLFFEVGCGAGVGMGLSEFRVGSGEAGWSVSRLRRWVVGVCGRWRWKTGARGAYEGDFGAEKEKRGEPLPLGLRGVSGLLACKMQALPGDLKSGGLSGGTVGR